MTELPDLPTDVVETIGALMTALTRAGAVSAGVVMARLDDPHSSTVELSIVVGVPQPDVTAADLPPLRSIAYEAFGAVEGGKP